MHVCSVYPVFEMWVVDSMEVLGGQVFTHYPHPMQEEFWCYAQW